MIPLFRYNVESLDILNFLNINSLTDNPESSDKIPCSSSFEKEFDLYFFNLAVKRAHIWRNEDLNGTTEVCKLLRDSST